MRKKIFMPIAFLIYTAILLAYSPYAHAQSEPKSTYNAPYTPLYKTRLLPQNDTADIMYAHLVRLLMDKKVPDFDFMYFRGQYHQTPQYDPLGEALIKRMQDLSFAVQKQNSAQALDEYTRLLRAHLANIAVVSQAISLSKQDPRFGDTQQLQKIRAGLFNTVIKSGDGMSLQGAYDVITMDEELLLLRHLNHEVLATKSAHEGLMHYNMHFVIERETQNPYTIFVNTTFPMQHLERERRKQAPTDNIPKR